MKRNNLLVTALGVLALGAAVGHFSSWTPPVEAAPRTDTGGTTASLPVTGNTIAGPGTYQTASPGLAEDVFLSGAPIDACVTLYVESASGIVAAEATGLLVKNIVVGQERTYCAAGLTSFALTCSVDCTVLWRVDGF